MREYGQIQTAFWASPDIQELSDHGKLLAAYLLTGPHSNGLGCYRLPDGYVMADFGWTQERVSKTFSELSANGFAKRCERSGFVLIPHFLRWNPIANANVAKAREKEFEAIPKNSSIYSELCRCMKRYGKHFRDGLETVLERYGKQDPTLPNPDPDPEPTQPTSCSEPQRASKLEAIFWMPLNDGSEHPITQAQADEWAGLFPAVDVMQALRSMKAWSLSNPSKRKTKAGVKRFITAWLQREQDKGGSGGAPGGGQRFLSRHERNQQAGEEFLRDSSWSGQTYEGEKV